EDDKAQCGGVEFLECVDDRSGVVNERVPVNDAGQDDDDRDVKNGTNNEGRDDTAWEIALRILTFLSGRRNRIEADVSEEDDGAPGEDTRPAVGREGVPVDGMNEF